MKKDEERISKAEKASKAATKKSRLAKKEDKQMEEDQAEEDFGVLLYDPGIADWAILSIKTRLFQEYSQLNRKKNFKRVFQEITFFQLADKQYPQPLDRFWLNFVRFFIKVFCMVIHHIFGKNL